MMDGLKNNMTFMVSNMAMIGWISYFFSGFVLGKRPQTTPCFCSSTRQVH